MNGHPTSDSENSSSDQPSETRPAWLKLIGTLTLLLLIPVIPLLILGTSFEERLNTWLEKQVSSTTLAWLGGTLLAADIAIPIPSSSVMTLLGAKLGVVTGTLVSVAGTTLGAIAGFALARGIGGRLVGRMSRETDVQSAARWVDRYGALILVIARGLPVIGEATVLAMGLYRQKWSHFLIAVVLANLVLGIAYNALGSWASERGWLPVALGVATALPLLPLVFVRWAQKRST